MPKNLTFRQCLSHLSKWLYPNRKKLILGLLMAAFTNVIYALMPMVEGSITTQLQLDISAIHNKIPGAHVQMDVILRFIGILLVIFFMKITAQILQAFWITDSIQATMADLRNAIEQKINRLPVSYFDNHPAGDLLSRITNDVETVSNALQQTLVRILNTILSLILISIMMFRISPMMFAMVMAGLPVIAFLSLFIMKKSQPVFDEQQQALSDLNSTINEMYGGINEIIIYNQQEYSKQKFDKVNRKMARQAYLAQGISGLIGPLCTCITYIVIGLVCLYGSFQVLAGALMLGQLQAFIRYIWNINDPISQLSQLSSAIQSGFSGMNRLFSFLDLPEEKQTATYKPVKEVESIDFDHIRFSYTDSPLMEDVTFHVKKNQTIAIVGHTGAGKTTLTNLLLRFYQLKGGSIKISGSDIQDLSFEDLRDKIGLVLQDPWLFEGTIEENLRYAQDGLREEELEKALETSMFAESLKHLPEGIQTHLSENAQNLSQGEKQLLTIARALLKNPEILVLDEATSSVDTRLEKRLQKAMENVMKDRTCFVIAHRLSTILNADTILVMNHGNLVEIGSHSELMKKNGVYANLYNSQFQTENETS